MIYEAKCPICHYVVEYSRPMRECMNTPDCPHCEMKMLKVIFTPPKGYVRGRWGAFKSTVDGSIIRNERELAEHNRRNNVESMSAGYATEQLMKMRGEQKREKVTAAEVADAYRAVEAGYKPKPIVEIDV